MVDIRNSIMLNMILGNMAEKVIDEVSDKVLDLLRRNIEKYVYLEGNAMYVPTYDFLLAFAWDDIKRDIKSLAKTMMYDPNGTGMTSDPQNWVHGSPIWGDAREYLADILNKKGYSSSLWISRKRTGAYWDITIKKLFDGRQISRWIDREIKMVASKYGFKAIKIK